MMTQEEMFIKIVDTLSKAFDEENIIYHKLKEHNIYIEIEKNPYNACLEDILRDICGNEGVLTVVLDYCYPVFEREAITPGELYDELFGEG